MEQTKINAAFKFMIEDEEWVQKLVIGSLLMLTIIGIIPVMGWWIEIARRVMNEEEPTLPGWEGFGDFILDGVKLWAATFIISLPVVLVLMLPAFAFLFFGMDYISYADPSYFIFFSLFTVCLMPLSMIFGILSYILQAVWIGMLADGAAFFSLFNFKQIYKLLRANGNGYVLAVVITYGLTIISSLAGTVMCFVGIFPVTVYGYTVMGYLHGQAYKDAKNTIAQEPLNP